MLCRLCQGCHIPPHVLLLEAAVQCNMVRVGSDEQSGLVKSA